MTTTTKRSVSKARQPMPKWMAAWALLHSFGVGMIVWVVFYG